MSKNQGGGVQVAFGSHPPLSFSLSSAALCFHWWSWLVGLLEPSITIRPTVASAMTVIAHIINSDSKPVQVNCNKGTHLVSVFIS